MLHLVMPLDWGKHRHLRWWRVGMLPEQRDKFIQVRELIDEVNLCFGILFHGVSPSLVAIGQQLFD